VLPCEHFAKERSIWASWIRDSKVKPVQILMCVVLLSCLQNHSPARLSDLSFSSPQLAHHSGVIVTETIQEHATAPTGTTKLEIPCHGGVLSSSPFSSSSSTHNPIILLPQRASSLSKQHSSGERGDASDSYGPSPLQPTTISPSPGETSTPLTTNCPHHHHHHHPPPHQLLPIPRKGSHSQMFAYAYGQIEKERAFGLKGQSPSVKDLEPSLLPPKTTAATSSEQQYYDDDAMVVVEKKRFKISLSFIDLSLVLKGSGKKILSNVTGKLAPGCITAVMGPSGAGKTMFLNALAGKSASFSHTTGQVLINGHPGSIHCYKRIIGFVPQDDVVHGSLTVEENLWFSASYRFTSVLLSLCLSLAPSSFVKIL